jgi:hypothetical protein
LFALKSPQGLFFCSFDSVLLQVAGAVKKPSAGSVIGAARAL